MTLLRIENLTVDYRRGGRRLRAVRDVSLDVEAGEFIGVAGESGCGKSTLALALLKLLPERESAIPAGRVLFEGRDLLRLPPEELRAVRGGSVAMVFQDPFSALNPVLTVGEQLEEVFEEHLGGRDRNACLDLLRRVRFVDPERVYGSYPHQISGGQRQRVCLAMAIAARPKLLIADEPTTALDVTIQKEILDLLEDLRRELGMAVILVTHNVGLIAERTGRLAVMYAGEIVELGETRSILENPLHPYTQGLLRSLPRISRCGTRNAEAGMESPAPQTPHSALPIPHSERLPMLPGQPPDLRAVPPGCPFHPRCPRAFDRCPRERPLLLPKDGRSVREQTAGSPSAGDPGARTNAPGMDSRARAGTSSAVACHLYDEPPR